MKLKRSGKLPVTIRIHIQLMYIHLFSPLSAVLHDFLCEKRQTESGSDCDQSESHSDVICTLGVTWLKFGRKQRSRGCSSGRNPFKVMRSADKRDPRLSGPMQVWFQNRRSKERRMKQLSALGARRHAFFRGPRRMRPLGGRLEDPDILGPGAYGYYGGKKQSVSMC